MGSSGCGYGTSVAEHGVCRLWIWGEGRPLWGKPRFCPQVADYGRRARLQLMGRIAQSAPCERGAAHDSGDQLWESVWVTGYGAVSYGRHGCFVDGGKLIPHGALLSVERCRVKVASYGILRG